MSPQGKIESDLYISFDEETRTLVSEFVEAVGEVKNSLAREAHRQELESRIADALLVVHQKKSVMDRKSEPPIESGNNAVWVIDQILRKLLGAEYSKWVADLEIDYDNGL